MSLYIEKFACAEHATRNTASSPLVLIHGWGMHGGVWQPLLEQLASHFCLYVIDLPGMGYSAPLAGVQAGSQQALLVIDKTVLGLRQTVFEAVHFVPLKSGVA